MSNRVSLLVACVAALMLLAVSASAAVPRCAEDGLLMESAQAYPAVVKGGLTYNGLRSCDKDQRTSFDVANFSKASSTLVMMNNWEFIVSIRSDAPVVYTLAAKCNDKVVCEADIAFVAKSSYLPLPKIQKL
ncbi:hypothetical protein ABL78_4150 [Leptomonas seymouri]|uniref:Uncharacterized protein n=1 Tax=Leptomonas seymouri TaxID=5684 RepID=A0A0N1HX09_LEPSE|nr:hypothetical protein ABL78_4150 [Leptomonas seymouri]|eukprot:KPI86781.1 hypothetical protein ABL78_4150 [Leptomonas seymouri]